MRIIEYKIENDNIYRTIESYLMKKQGYSRNIIRKLKTPDGIKLNGSFARVIDEIAVGDRLTICLCDESREESKSKLFVPVIYEDDDVIVYNKPPFMATHPSKLHQQDSLANVFFADMEKRGLNLPFRAVYRLDRDTDGLILIAKNNLAAAKLAGKIKKEYTGIIMGKIIPENGTINAPIAQLVPHKMKRGVRSDGQEAFTEYKTIGGNEKYTVLTFNLKTGRTHQIRVHMSYMGHPLAGDSMYGGDNSLDRQALCCTAVRFIHPVSGKCINLCINMHEDMRKLIKSE